MVVVAILAAFQVDGARRVGIVEALREDGVVVALVLMGRVRLAAVAGDGGHDGRRLARPLARAVLHAQLEKHVLQRVEPVQIEEIVRRLFGQQVTGAHQANLHYVIACVCNRKKNMNEYIVW